MPKLVRKAADSFADAREAVVDAFNDDDDNGPDEAGVGDRACKAGVVGLEDDAVDEAADRLDIRDGGRTGTKDDPLAEPWCPLVDMRRADRDGGRVDPTTTG